MKDINIGKTLSVKRKEKGITQDQLAEYIGVSKASVSKWETGQSYPDVTFLPQLAAYFNITIDELLSYSPQMTKWDIRKLYQRLAKKFSTSDFEEVYSECREMIKKYYSCFPLLMQMSILLCNHFMLAAEEKQMSVLEEVIELCTRISIESDEVKLRIEANHLKGYCLLLQNRPSEVVDLLDDDGANLEIPNNSLLANAYLSMGNIEKAKEVLQVEIYKSVQSIISDGQLLITANSGNQEKIDEIVDLLKKVSEAFNIDSLNVNTGLLLRLHSAIGMMSCGNQQKALQYLQEYTDICCKTEFPMKLHGNSFFDSIDEWINKLDMGDNAPRDSKVIKESMVQGLTSSPLFQLLADNPEYKLMLSRLQENAGKE